MMHKAKSSACWTSKARSFELLHGPIMVQDASILARIWPVSLENARSTNNSQGRARLERDLQAAKRIQGALSRPVPTEIMARYGGAGTYPPARSAATSMSFCATARSNWESHWAT